MRDQKLAERMITTTTAAQVIGVSGPTMRRLIRLGAIPAYRVGRRALRVKLTDVEQYVLSRAVRPAPISPDLPEALTKASRSTEVPEVRG
jgi:excisionase family DNA binding protein